jgi:Na+/proline symporter
MDPLIINALVAIAVCLFFLVQGALYYREIKDEESFFLYNRRLPSGEYARSFAAASTSLATVLFFFVTHGVKHGIYILFAPLTYVLGCYLYSKLLLPRLEDQGFFSERKTSLSRKITLGTTLGNYIEQRYKSRAVKFSVIIVTLLGMASILLIELYVGVNIFSIYLKTQFVDLALLGVTFVVFSYTALGGFISVVKTDVFQLRLMFLSTFVFLVWLVWTSVHNHTFPTVETFLVHPLVFKGGILLPYTLLFNILIVNLFLVPALLRTWQMAAASPNSEEVRRGIMKGVVLTVLLTAMFILLGILFFRSVFPKAEHSLTGMLKALYTSQNSLARFIIFPLFFAGCLAALLSTADSALAPILQSLFQDFRNQDFRNQESSWEHRYRYVLLLTALLFIITIGLYFIVFRILGFTLITWLFTIFSFLIISAPSIIFAVIAPDNMIGERSARITAFISIWGGLMIAIAFSIIGNKLEKIELVQLNSPLSALFGSLCFLIFWLIYKAKQRGVRP